MAKNLMPKYVFPNYPEKWTQEERLFGQGLRTLFDRLFAKPDLKEIYPVGMVLLTDSNTKPPFTFGEWDVTTSGITDVYAWKRTR